MHIDLSKSIFIVGPTGVGKTTVSIALARRVDGEIVSADSMQVYRGMRVGTCAPTEEEKQGVPHHLVQELAPDQPYSAAIFREKALRLIREIHDRARIPIVVGGSGLYFRALVDGLFDAPPSDPELRSALVEEARRDGVEALHRRLQKLDPESALRIQPRDLRRIVRSLEVYKLTGQPISELQTEWNSYSEPKDFYLIGLTRPREELYKRTNARVKAIFANGLVDEVLALAKTGYGKDLERIKALGYMEVLEYLSEGRALGDVIEQVKISTRHYARRQMMWFRRDPRIQWLELGAEETPDETCDRILEKISGKSGVRGAA